MPPAAPRAPDHAPYWHTGLLVALIVAVAGTGTMLARYQPATAVTEYLPDAPTLARSRSFTYLSSIVVTWALVGYVARVGRARSHLRELIGRVSMTPWGIATDVGLALLLWLLIESAERIAVRALGVAGGAGILLPYTSLERAEWVACALSVGFCEEVVYRGYLQNAFAAWLGRPWTAVVLQGSLFGLAHAEQGAWPALARTGSLSA